MWLSAGAGLNSEGMEILRALAATSVLGVAAWSSAINLPPGTLQNARYEIEQSLTTDAAPAAGLVVGPDPPPLSGQASPQWDNQVAQEYDPTFVPTEDNILQGVTVLLNPEYGGGTNEAFKWYQQNITVSLEGQTTPDFTNRVTQTLAWVSRTTGKNVTLVNQAGDIKVNVQAGNRALTTVTFDSNGRIHSVAIKLDPQAKRAIWEELSQAMGATGDSGPANNSVFTNDLVQGAPTQFDAWLLHSLYHSVPAGANATQVAQALRTS